MSDFLSYFFLVNPSLTAGLVNFGVAAWIVYAGLKTHFVLTHTYHSMPAEVLKKRSLFRPLCVQAARAASLFGLCYCVGEIHWIAESKWDDIGNPADLIWCVIEFLGFYTILLWLRLGRMIARQNQERRHRDDRCPDERDCPVRKRCLQGGSVLLDAGAKLLPLSEGKK